jgi:DNA topoisomerase IA
MIGLVSGPSFVVSGPPTAPPRSTRGGLPAPTPTHGGSLDTGGLATPPHPPTTHASRENRYDVCSARFLGSLSDDLELKRTSVTLELRGGPKTETFVLEHVEVEKIGFGNFCPWVLNDVRAHKSPINLRVGDVFNASATLQKLKTRPPRFLQEHELVELMDTHRIGTDVRLSKF